MRKLVISLAMTGILLLSAGFTGLFLNKNNRNTRDNEIYTLEELTENVENLSENYSVPLKITLIYFFENREPYFLNTESVNGRGAMELCASIQIGQIYPERSVARMRNVKYMQHVGNCRIIGSGLMG